MPRTPTAARSRSSAAAWCATWASPRTSATSRCPRASSSTTRRRATCPTTASSTCPPGRRASRWPCSRAWRTSSTQIEVGEGDTVILASSLIPGNENAVYRVINGLTKLGANVVHKGNAKVHVSGHAAAGELLYCYNILKPRNVLPVHGEYRHLMANARLAQRHRHPGGAHDHRRERHRHRPQGRRRARSSASSTSASSTSTARRVGEITDADLKDRRILAEEGFISIIVVGRRRRPGGSSRARRSTRAASPRTRRCSTTCKPKIVAALTEAAQNGVRDSHALSAGRPPHDRPLGQQSAAPPPDDHPARHRGVTRRDPLARMPQPSIWPAMQAEASSATWREAANWRHGVRRTG